MAGMMKCWLNGIDFGGNRKCLLLGSPDISGELGNLCRMMADLSDCCAGDSDIIKANPTE